MGARARKYEDPTVDIAESFYDLSKRVEVLEDALVRLQGLLTKIDRFLDGLNGRED